MDRITQQGSNPLLYILYAYVRARSIFDRVCEIDAKVAECKFVPPTILSCAVPPISLPIYTLAGEIMVI